MQLNNNKETTLYDRIVSNNLNSNDLKETALRILSMINDEEKKKIYSILKPGNGSKANLYAFSLIFKYVVLKREQFEKVKVTDEAKKIFNDIMMLTSFNVN